MARSGWTSPLSPTSTTLDSRIPRFSPSDSPSSLRRTSSMRVSHKKTDHFPAITENAKYTPKRSNSSLSLTPLRSRRSCGTHHGAEAEFSDVDSVKSFGSTASGCCEHSAFGLNGTTWSGRSRRYVVRCSTGSNLGSEPEEYLTPTQRAARQLRQSQSQLRQAQSQLDDKDRQIAQLTKELVELRLYKASALANGSSPDDSEPSTTTGTASTVEHLQPDLEEEQLDAPKKHVLPRVEALDEAAVAASSSSLLDSGHFEASSSSSASSTATALATASAANQLKENVLPGTSSMSSSIIPEESSQCRKLLDEIQQLKETHNDRVEALLNQLSEMSTRYYEARPALDAAEARNKQLQKELDDANSQIDQLKALITQMEEQNKQMYLKMYVKGQEAAKIIEQTAQVSEQAQNSPSHVSVAELLQQLTLTQAELENTKQDHASSSTEPLTLAKCSQCLLSVQEAVSLWVLGMRKAMYRRIMESKNQDALDPEITLQFLKSAVYYFLTDKENLQGHLNAIESILGFTESEKVNIDRIYRSVRK